MKLTVQEAAQLLGADEQKVHDWIESHGLPAQRVRGVFRVNRTELLEWATENDIAVEPRAFTRESTEAESPALVSALRAGGIHYGVPGSTIEEALRNVIALLQLSDDADRDMLRHFLMARDKLGVAPLGDGIAIPHVRTPIILAPSGSTAALAFLETPLPIPTPDGRGVDTLFFLICPTVHAHLAMLARLAFVLRAPAFRAAVKRRAPAEEILRIAEEVEE